MKYNIQELFELIIKLVAASESATARMQQLVDYCAVSRPHAAWSKLRQVDFEADLTRVPAWMSAFVSNAPTDLSPRGLWFGLMNPVRENVASADIYAASSPSFSRETLDWATEVDYVPESSELVSNALQSIYSLAYKGPDELGNDAEYPLVLAYGAIVARCAVERIPAEAQFNRLAGAAVGFDSGDFLYLGVFEAGRFVLDISAG